jgi:hypothetical protein
VLLLPPISEHRKVIYCWTTRMTRLDTNRQAMGPTLCLLRCFEPSMGASVTHRQEDDMDPGWPAKWAGGVP